MLVEDLLKYFTSIPFIISCVIVVIMFVVITLMNRFYKLFKKKSNLNDYTVTNVTFDAVRILIIVLLILTILQINGFNVTSLITGLGVVSVVVGLALQDIMKDVIMGFRITTDKFFSLGDVVKFNDEEGTVISFNLRVTKIKSIKTGDILTVSNRNISEMTISSEFIDIDCPVPYDINALDMKETMIEVCERITQLKDIEICRYMGVNSFEDSCIIHKLRVYTDPHNRYQIRRNAQQLILEIFDEKGISIPYNQIDVHMK